MWAIIASSLDGALDQSETHSLPKPMYSVSMPIEYGVKQIVLLMGIVWRY